MTDCPDNLKIYEAVRSVPSEAQKSFNNGRFSGTDINPMWRIKTLTEQFGPCGFGWYYEILRTWSEQFDAVNVKIFMEIALYISRDGAWSKPILGTGGNTFIGKNSDGKINVNDECYKMALTDALSVACKALGIGADIYFSKDRTKYDLDDGKIEQTPTEFKKICKIPENDRFFNAAPKKAAKPEASPAAEVPPGFTTADQIMPEADIAIPPEAEICNILNVKGAMPKFKETVKAFKLNKGAKSVYDLSYEDKVELFYLIQVMEESA